ncbi:MAG: (2Fe-2S)-binding protein [Rhodanobacteraceae bacterium]|jgi:sarcosine oxidase subunit alpha|nr:MAG: (2Fe-2S)-binding protein [Rhodanobacteraceae bacterium]
MTASVSLTVNGKPVEVIEGASVAAAVAQAGAVFRRSLTGEPRAALCGMGVCFECRVTIDGVAHQQACTLPVRVGMQVVTDG